MGGVSADGKVLWLSGRYDAVVYAISTRATGGCSRRIPVGAGPARPLRLAAAGPLLARPHRHPPLRRTTCVAPEVEGYAEVVSGVGILVVDDDAPIRRMLERTLAAEGYDVRRRARRRRARWPRSSGRRPTCSCSTSRMPGLDGLAVCRRLRGQGPRAADPAADRARRGRATASPGSTPAPTTTSSSRSPPRSCSRACARCCAAGASRRGARVRRPRPRRRARGRRGAAARELALSAREAELLELLLRNPRQVVTRELALEQVWGGEAAASPNVVDRYVAYLRRKLGEPPLIQTVRGVGFVLER